MLAITVWSVDQETVDQEVGCIVTFEGNESQINCECTNGAKYDATTNQCVEEGCPTKFGSSGGKFPNCTCDKNFDYSAAYNLCFRVCPDNSTGYWPHCDCDYDGYVFDKSIFQCVACPNDSLGM